jgi:hypothetical protein
MTQKRLLRFSLGLAALSCSGAVMAQDAPDTRIDRPLVSSTVIIEGELQTSNTVPADQSGLTVDPVSEDAAEQIRRDAEQALARKRLSNILPINQPSVTVVSVDQVVVERPKARDSEACVTIGKVGARKGCRPPRK